MRDKPRVRQGVILAHLNLDRVDRIVRERTGLGESGETYLVGSLVTKNTLISKEEANIQEFTEGISSQGIDAAMSGVSNSGLYRNYAGVPVIGCIAGSMTKTLPYKFLLPEVGSLSHSRLCRNPY